MFLGEPPRTQFDLHFHVFGFPIRVHPFFWLIGVVMGFQLQDPVLIAIWIGVVFFSILVHELGHAIVMRRLGEDAHIVLHAFGGLAIQGSGGLWDSRSSRARSPRDQILISAAGPAAGFVLAILVIALIFATGGTVSVPEDLSRTLPRFWDFQLGGKAATNEYVINLFHFLLYVNIFWGLMNLLPVMPLDGGQICEQLLAAKDPWQGRIKALWVSVFTGGGVAILALLVGDRFFLVLLFGALAVSSYMTIQQLRGGGYGGGRPW